LRNNYPLLLPSLRSGLAATRHPFGDGLREATAAASQPQPQPTTFQTGLPSEAPLDYI